MAVIRVISIDFMNDQFCYGRLAYQPGCETLGSTGVSLHARWQYPINTGEMMSKPLAIVIDPAYAIRHCVD